MPWSTHEHEPWPKRKKYKKRKAIPLEAQNVTLQAQASAAEQIKTPVKNQGAAVDAPEDSSHTEETASTVNVTTDTLTTSTPEPTKQHSTASLSKSSSVVTPTQPTKGVSRTAIPAIPLVPVLPKDTAADSSKLEADKSEPRETPSEDPQAPAEVPEENQEAKSAAPRPSYRNWADVLKPMTAPKATTTAKSGTNGTAANGSVEIASEQPGASGVAKSGAVALAEVLKSYRVGGSEKTGEKLVFIEPRGLHNSGVDCFMNSVSSILRHYLCRLLILGVYRSFKYSSFAHHFMHS